MSMQCWITIPSHRCLLKCRNEYITETRPLLKQNSPMSCSIALPASCGPRRGKGKASEAKDRSRGSAGFGRERKELWSCSQGCGACCKLDKGPAFATPEEIFDDPDHVKADPIFVVWNQRYLKNYMALMRRNSTRKHVAVAGIPSKRYTERIQRSWIISIAP